MLITKPLALAIKSSSAASTYYEDGGRGPSKWASLDITNNQCGGLHGLSGFGQSPVAVPDAVVIGCDTDLASYSFRNGTCTFSDLNFTIGSSGVMVAPTTTSNCTFGTITVPQSSNEFQCAQFHIHTSSEHTISGRISSAELHMVHSELDEPNASYAVLGAMLEVGNKTHQMFEYFLQGWEAVAEGVENACNGSNALDEHLYQRNFPCPLIGTNFYGNSTPSYPTGPVELYSLPTSTEYGFFTYKGGLTTPPCTEMVNWNLMDKPILVSRGQMDRIFNLILCHVDHKTCEHATVANEEGGTSRPLQDLLGRRVIHRCANGPNVTKADIGVLPRPSSTLLAGTVSNLPLLIVAFAVIFYVVS